MEESVHRRTPAAVSGPPNTMGLEEATLAAEIGRRLPGTPADGSRTPPRTTEGVVVWTDRGDDVLLYINGTRVRLLDRMLYVSVDLETDQTGRTPLVCAFAFGNPDDPAGLVAVTDELPRGNGLLASRWGEALQAAIWNALLGIISDFAKQSGLTPAGMAAVPGALILRADT